jgi:hypothetical protein
MVGRFDTDTGFIHAIHSSAEDFFRDRRISSFEFAVGTRRNFITEVF